MKKPQEQLEQLKEVISAMKFMKGGAAHACDDER